MDWYYKIEGLQKGPVQEDILRRMIATGELGPEVEASCDTGESCWCRLGDLENFREELNTAAMGKNISARAFMPNREITATALRKLKGQHLRGSSWSRITATNGAICSCHSGPACCGYILTC